ncbi:hypothetical protein RB195_000955 [Necator americanus]|uniref:Uncharacterized protein n=1 Tax=Necator americanus TaxID=51031 RepID=A0ABR1DDE0_NECAM
MNLIRESKLENSPTASKTENWLIFEGSSICKYVHSQFGAFLLLFILMILAHIFILIFSSTTCCRKSDEEESATEVVEESEEPPSSGSASLEGAADGELSAENVKAPPLEMSADNPEVRFVQQFQGEPTEEFVKNVTGVANSASVYIWGAKKRAAALTAAWKDLAKRITILQTEGFDVLAGSDEAKELRKIESQRHLRPSLLDKIEPKKEKKKKKKKKRKHRRDE